MSKCSCYHTRKKDAYVNTSFGLYRSEVTIGECWGTKERDECSCGGDTSKCDFYPEKRKENDNQARPKIIAIDFDGTLCTNAWPEIGEPHDEMISFMKKLHQKGHKIILWTCREGENLEKALKWCAERGIVFDAVNDNLEENKKFFGGNSRKISADYYIDDKAFNALPL